MQVVICDENMQISELDVRATAEGKSLISLFSLHKSYHMASGDLIQRRCVIWTTFMVILLLL